MVDFRTDADEGEEDDGEGGKEDEDALSDTAAMRETEKDMAAAGNPTSHTLPTPPHTPRPTPQTQTLNPKP